MQRIDRHEDNGAYFPEVYFTHDWLKKNLLPEYYAMLPALPLTFRLRLNRTASVIAFHAAYHNTESYSCGSDRSLEQLRGVYGSLVENIVVYGHYHEPHVIPMDGKLLVNCASIGARKNDCLSNYTVIEYDEEKLAISQKQVPYDKAEEDRLIAERGMVRRA